jgi:DNA-binding transcriptional LysR family regulator
MINLNQLRAFYQAAKCQNVSVAAQQLFVSQPAVTAQIKLFEDSCGLRLFKKKGRNLYLTDEGKTLFNYARKIFEYERKIEDAVGQMKELKKGSLRLGSARTYAHDPQPDRFEKRSGDHRQSRGSSEYRFYSLQPGGTGAHIAAQPSSGK